MQDNSINNITSSSLSQEDRDLLAKHLPREIKDEVMGVISNTIAPKKEDGSKVSTYDGDAVNIKEAGDTLSNFDAISNEVLQIDDPAMVVEIFDPAVANGQVELHTWQVNIAEELATGKRNAQHPFKKCVCACNGSGKDRYVITPFVVWLALRFKRSLSIITSAGGVQLSAQTEGPIKHLCEQVNKYFGQKIFKINQRFIYCNLTGSEIRLFATDEAGKAEGYHPLEAGAEMAIIVNEAKTVAPDIFGALKRCTGFTYWLNVSTPGEPYGDFYDSFTRWPNSIRVSTFDCPHLSASEREEERITLGEHSALYRSKHLALFTSLGGQVIIPKELTTAILEKIKQGLIPLRHQNWKLRIGGDLAAGGDETVLTGVLGNRITQRVSFIQKDTVLAADIIEFHFKNTFKVNKDHEHIYMDDGGVGRGIIDNLRRRGWDIKRILNQSAANMKKEFGNRGAEAWFRAKRILEENLFVIDEDEKFTEQLSNRYYKQQSTQGRITLEAKQDAKAHGRPSPDRADSFLLALTGLTIDDYLGHAPEDAALVESKKEPKARVINEKFRTQEDADEYMEKLNYGNSFATNANKQSSNNDNKPKRLHGSISCYLNN